MSNLYAERDIIGQGNYYSRHTSAMTGEGLHNKSDVAAELAHRDIQIDQLRQQLEQAEARVVELEGQPCVKQLASLMRGLEIKPGFASMLPEGFYALGRAIADQAKSASEPAILRKQAEAVIPAIMQALKDLGNADLTYSGSRMYAEDYAQRLRQQSDESERGES